MYIHTYIYIYIYARTIFIINGHTMINIIANKPFPMKLQIIMLGRSAGIGAAALAIHTPPFSQQLGITSQNLISPTWNGDFAAGWIYPCILHSGRPVEAWTMIRHDLPMIWKNPCIFEAWTSFSLRGWLLSAWFNNQAACEDKCRWRAGWGQEMELRAQRKGSVKVMHEW